MNSDYSDDEEHLALQIEQAARGCISGSLREWPYLHHALLSKGIDLPLDTPALELQKVCLTLLEGLHLMKLYMWWSSKYLQEYSNGHIIVMAKNVEQAVVKARKELETNVETYLSNLYLDLDERVEYEAKLLALITSDLAKEPVVVVSGVLLIRGSE